MKLVYFGSSYFSARVLDKLLKTEYRPEFIVSTPDKPAGRGLHLKPTPVKELAVRCGLPVFTPESLRREDTVSLLQSLSADLFVVVGYGKIIPAGVLKLPEILPIALHPSLLPEYRGAAPINWVLIRGETVTGVTVFKVEREVDSGDIILQRQVPISEDDNATTLTEKLIEPSADLLAEACYMIENNSYKLIPQDERRCSYAPKLKKEDGLIKWDNDVVALKNFIRGMHGWPGAYTFYRDLMLKITAIEAYEEEVNVTPGAVVKIGKEGIDVAARGGFIRIKRLKPAGKKEMDAASFVNGHHIKEGDVLG